MQWLRTVAALREQVASWRGSTIGLVPTMGSLHEGHLSLIRRCRQECDHTVVSIFVNPLQFGPNEDWDRYPRDEEGDRALCEAAGVDVVFAPDPQEMGADPATAGDRTWVMPPESLLQTLCAPHRPGHFRGVATIVLQLLNLVQPQRAYFGQKDAQQLAIIQRLVQDLQIPTTIVPCPTVREADGLAYSSRNRYLSAVERQVAASLYRALRRGYDHWQAGDPSAEGILAAARAELERTPELRVQYLELVDPQTLQPLSEVKDKGLLAIAAYVGQTRLIDNLLLSPEGVDPLPQEQQSAVPPSPKRGRRPLIAIDGPAGAGKSSVARAVAAQLQLLYLDTGAMYRAITWLALQRGIPLDDAEQLTQLAAQTQLTLQSGPSADEPTRIWADGEEVTQAIRSPEVTRWVSQVAAVPGVRQELVKRQRLIGRDGGAVLEGRDIGTHVFPDAELKVFLTASVGERAQRRQHQLQAQGQVVSLEELKAQIEQRDRRDSERLISPLRPAPDAILIDTDHLSQAEVEDKIVRLYRQLLERSGAAHFDII
ncbi:bifunctional pantoate ligase/cytidylate kinase [Synechococcus sp. 63AY4M2]|uniref:Bifunctional pantoate ligase/cytidylate kinase n=2 Tax=unclassified Synechococcus TaxID=2626047 RepID=PANCY_SYNJA|nr:MULTISPECIES: bifunctional pantoate--beta-alanine ligase/(d)CMP kinase [unclassified Synechococcus]Q2JRH9.1 RecName: Full=Bifunctional pantoate ligase/cytidylate kinase; Includes: RecName: Full=Pantothenate synthetase; Short=PS; AltName: Full=Pantoate--beta-alanine ligase; AltName: Full=Pantoate-activating enzyme; Includes: RecName: Full=Cytidylate kinase; Short=CK; AltName: Full=Cytidine monophosphate kinase; Short=CMP kinase [Synechococcus sp. JA-3-3Ab]ABD00775.1 pantoate--beta-alanine ligas